MEPGDHDYEGENSKMANSIFTSAMTLTKLGVPRIPQRYVLPPSDRPSCLLNLSDSTSSLLPTLDLSSLDHPSFRPHVVNQIRSALCIYMLAGDKPWNPSFSNEGRIGGSNGFLQLATDKIHFWRDFIKHYSNPISNWIHLWPSNPQVIAVNYYPACPEPELALGMPPHSDYGSLTVLLQSSPGLQLRNANNDWLSVPVIEGGLIVQLGDQMEVMSNGLYESIIHRVTVNAEDKRISIASLHSLALNKKIRPAPELLDGQNLSIQKNVQSNTATPSPVV